MSKFDTLRMTGFSMPGNRLISRLRIAPLLVRHKPDYSLTFFGFFHMCDLGVPLTFHFHKKNYGIIRNIFTEWCFDS